MMRLICCLIYHCLGVSFVLILKVLVNSVSVISGCDLLGITSIKQVKCLAQGHNIVPLVRFEPGTLPSQD